MTTKPHNTQESSPLTSAYATPAALSLFADAKHQFNDMISHLASAECARLEHGDVERYVAEQGHELLRRLLQAHFTQRAQQEQPLAQMPFPAETQGPRLRLTTQRQLLTLYGPVNITRLGYSAKGLPSVFPLDAQLNLPADRYSEGLRLRVVADAVHSAFDVCLKRLDETTAAHVPKRQALALVQDVAQDYAAFYQYHQPPAEATDDLLVLSFDGKGIVMRPDSLRGPTQRKAARAKPKLQTRLSAGEKKDRKRMAQVVAVHDQPVRVRAPEDIIRLTPEQKSTRAKPPPIRNKRTWASLEREPAQVIEEAFTEALKRDPQRKRLWVILVDGQKHQLQLIHRVLNRLQLKATIVMDFIHVLEYLWTAAWCLHRKGDPAAEVWVAERATKLLSGEIGQVIKGLKLNARALPRNKRDGLDKCIRYLSNNRSRLQYDRALADGLPIATGVIEGACRHLINDRLDITGARWSLAGAEALLNLRSIYASGDWEQYIKFHRQQAKKRQYEHCTELAQAA